VIEQLAFADEAMSGAEFSDDAVYRYRLWRTWGSRPPLVFVMLNPSTADGTIDDPTIRRCMGFAKREGDGGIIVVNLYALRATDPKALRTHPSPVGPLNDQHIAEACRSAEYIVAAWGADPMAPTRSRTVAAIARAAGKPLVCLGRTRDGAPRHPLYLKGDAGFQEWAG
jgi:hypothetical protein